MNSITPIVHFELHEYTHGFEIRKPTPHCAEYINTYAYKFRIKGYATDKQKKEGILPDKGYIPCKYNMFYRFHKGHLEEFIKYMFQCGYPENSYTHFQYGLDEPVRIVAKPTTSKSPRGQQPDAIKFVTDDNDKKINAKLLEMPTGTGKTFVSLYCACEKGLRTAIIVGGGYVEKWIGDVISNTDVVREDIYVVKGGSSLLKLLHSSREEIANIKFIVISLETLGVFFKAYETNDGSVENTAYPYPPEVMYSHLGIGFVIYDEIHESMIQVYRSLAYTHVDSVLGLSATFISLQESVLDMQRLLFPSIARYDEIKMSRYISLYPVEYLFNNFNNLNVKTRMYGMTTYSHVAYEQWVFKRKGILRSYLTMIGYCMHHMYNGGAGDYKAGDRAIIFCSTVEMIDAVVEFLKDQYPQLLVRRYVSVDPYENLISSDICVTTPGSGGTAVDIANLTVAIQTVNIQSPVQNLQSLGRLRHIADRQVKYLYLFCSQIPSHKAYHFQRLKMFEYKTKSILNLNLPFNL